MEENGDKELTGRMAWECSYSTLEMFASLFGFPLTQKTPTPPLLLLLAVLLNVINYHICSPLEKIPQSLLVVGKQYEVCSKKQEKKAGVCCHTSN